jgi:hypothetical protein
VGIGVGVGVGVAEGVEVKGAVGVLVCVGVGGIAVGDAVPRAPLQDANRNTPRVSKTQTRDKRGGPDRLPI